MISVEIDLAEIPDLRRSIGLYRDRRPDIWPSLQQSLTKFNL